LDLKNQGKKPPKQERLVFLETTAHGVGETAENQRKTREKSKVAENQVFWLDFCAKKKNCAYPLWRKKIIWGSINWLNFINEILIFGYLAKISAFCVYVKYVNKRKQFGSSIYALDRME
jgi:hypothetical protein